MEITLSFWWQSRLAFFYGFIPNTKDGLVILTNGDGGIDLRQDIYHAWIEYETGKLPESYVALAEQRKSNSIISIVIGAALGMYLLLFIIRLYKGRRSFIFKQVKKSYIGLVVRTFLLIITAVLIFVLPICGECLVWIPVIQ